MDRHSSVVRTVAHAHEALRLSTAYGNGGKITFCRTTLWFLARSKKFVLAKADNLVRRMIEIRV